MSDTWILIQRCALCHELTHTYIDTDADTGAYAPMP